MMDYFRRPALAGNNIVRMTRATIRGSKRRADADSTSAVPYFAGAALGQTLLVSIDGGAPVTVTLTDPNLAGSSIYMALADINTALNGLVPGATAFDADGTLALRSNSTSSTASIEVTGGTAAKALGFDVSLGRYRGFIGDIPSSPEGRVGNAFGTSFLNKDENLTSESISRSLARFAANTDILYSELLRGDVLPRKVSYTSSDRIHLVPPATTRVFNGFGALSSTPSKEELARYFFLVDPVTQLPPASRVVGLQNASAVNLLGQDLVKASLAITNIYNGRVMECLGSSFITASKVVAGDYVSIDGATNGIPWSNNGYRWVVEEVITEMTLALRPMSKSELALVGTSTAEVQPVLELNGAGSGFGTATIRSGPFSVGATLVVDPPMPVGSAYDLYVGTPGDQRSKKPYEAQASDVLKSSVASDLRPLPNAILVPPRMTTGTDFSHVALTDGYARFSGRVVHIPATTFVADPALMSTPGINNENGPVAFIYWDQDTNEVKITRDPDRVFNSSVVAGTAKAQHLLYTVLVVDTPGPYLGWFTNLFDAARVDAQSVQTLTVGTGGEFADLHAAIAYTTSWSYGNGQVAVNPQFEIVLLSNSVFSGQIPLSVSMRIRGATPDVTLSLPSMQEDSSLVFGYGAFSLVLEDLRIDTTSSSSFSMLAALPTGGTLVLNNVTIHGDLGRIADVVGGEVILRDSDFQSLVMCALSTDTTTPTTVDVSNCTFRASDLLADPTFTFLTDNGNPVVPTVFSTRTGLGLFLGDSVAVRDSVFTNLFSPQATTARPVIGRFGAGSTLFENCRFYDSPVASPSEPVLFQYSNQAVNAGYIWISKCSSITPSMAFINSPDGTDALDSMAAVEDCNISVAPVAATSIQVPVLRGSTITSTGGTGSLVAVSRECSGNVLTGTAGLGISNMSGVSDPVRRQTLISNNRIELIGATAIQVTSITSGLGLDKGVVVTGNQIVVGGLTAQVGIKTWKDATSLQLGVISENLIRFRCDYGAGGHIGIDVRGNSLVTANQLTIEEGQDDAMGLLTGIFIREAFDSGAPRVMGNTVYLAYTTGLNSGVKIDGGSPFYLSSNFISAPNALVFTNPAYDPTRIVDGNFLRSVNGSSVLLLGASRFSHNSVYGPVTSPSPGITDEVSDNFFDSNAGNVALVGKDTAGMVISGNQFTTETTGTGSTSVLITGAYADLYQNTFLKGLDAVLTAVARVENNSFINEGYVNLKMPVASLLVSGNLFDSPSMQVSIWALALDVSFNQFKSSVGGVAVGQSGLGSSYTRFTDNQVSANCTLTQDQTGQVLAVDRNLFTSGAPVTMSMVSSLSGNRFIDTSLNITGASAATGLSGVPAEGNSFIGNGNKLFEGLLFSGMLLENSGTATFTDCRISSSEFSFTGAMGPSVTLQRCDLSACRFTGAQGSALIAPALVDSTLVGCSFGVSDDTVTALNGSMSVGGNSIVSGFRVLGNLAITYSGSSSLALSDSFIGGTLSVAGSSVAALLLSSCRVGDRLGAVSTNSFTATSMGTIKVQGLLLANGSLNLDAVAVELLGSDLGGALLTHTMSPSSSLLVRDVSTGGDISHTGTGPLVSINGNRCRSVSLTGSRAFPQVQIQNNVIDASGSSGVVPLYVAHGGIGSTDQIVKQSWVISGNEIHAGQGTSVIQMVGTTSPLLEQFFNVLISGNRLTLPSIQQSSPNPGLAAGVYDISVIHFGQTLSSGPTASLVDLLLHNNIINGDNDSFGPPHQYTFGSQTWNMYLIKVSSPHTIIASGNLMKPGWNDAPTSSDVRCGKYETFTTLAGLAALQ